MRELQEKGFSLIEVIVAVSILVILAGIAVPVISSQVEKAKVGKIVSLVETLRGACDRYKADMGTYPREIGTSRKDTYHLLSLKPKNDTNWDGPYIDHPLADMDNPFGGDVYLYDNLTGSKVTPKGFDLLGSGKKTHTGDGNFIGFTDIPQDIAEMVDEALDQGVKGNWKTTGRVEYQNNKLAIYLLGGN